MARDFESNSNEELIAADITPPITDHPVSLSIWMRPESIINSTMLSFSDNGADDTWFRIIMLPGGEARYQIRDGGGAATASTTNTASSGTWHHVVAVDDGTDATVILDGDTANEGTGTTSSIVPTGIDTISIAVLERLSELQWFDGALAEAAAWNVALDSSERAALANGVSPLMVRPSALKLYVPMIRGYSELMSNIVFTATGGADFPHPRIIYPSAQILQFPPAGAAPAAASPRLTLLGVG